MASAYASQINNVQKEIKFIKLCVWILAQAGEVAEYQKLESSLKYKMAAETQILTPSTVEERSIETLDQNSKFQLRALQENVKIYDYCNPLQYYIAVTK